MKFLEELKPKICIFIETKNIFNEKKCNYPKIKTYIENEKAIYLRVCFN